MLGPGKDPDLDQELDNRSDIFLHRLSHYVHRLVTSKLTHNSSVVNFQISGQTKQVDGLALGTIKYLRYA